uniref:Ovule protein n=1 Tax=Heterorhabditis bacteriophora TaxID=37862 RepID=A0A1I7W9I3_HETBA
MYFCMVSNMMKLKLFDDYRGFYDNFYFIHIFLQKYWYNYPTTSNKKQSPEEFLFLQGEEMSIRVWIWLKGDFMLKTTRLDVM